MADPTAALFSELHRRHPDVDLVILPPDVPVPADEPVELAPEDAAARVDRVTATASTLWSAVDPDGEPPAPTVRWAHADSPDAVRAVARVVAHRDDGFHVLVGLRHELEVRGWAVTRPPRGLERLTGRLDDLTLTASYAEPSGAVVMSVSTGPVLVGAAAAARLVRGEH